MARKVQLRNKNGEKAYPVTSSELVKMSSGGGNLDGKLTELENKEVLRYIDGAFKEAERITTEETGLIDKKGNHDNRFGNYFSITNDGGTYNNEVIFVRCKLFYLFDDNWTNVTLKNKNGNTVYNTPIRIMNDVIFVLPPKYTLEICCNNNYIEKVKNTEFDSKYIGFSNLFQMINTANSEISELKISTDDLKSKVENLMPLTQKVANIEGEIYETVETVIENSIQTGLINVSDGTVNTSLGSEYQHSVLEVKEYEEYSIKSDVTVISNDNFALIAYYAGEEYLKEYTLTVSKNDGSNKVNKKVIIPTGCTKIKIATAGNGKYLEVKKLIQESNFEQIKKNFEKLETEKVGTPVFEFEINNLKRRCKNIEDSNPFEFKDFDGCYISLVIDDGNQHLKSIYEVCKELNVPLCAAVPYAAMSNTYDGSKIQDVCNMIIDDGGEVLCHNSIGSIYYQDDTEPDSSFEDYYNAFVVQKQKLEELGFRPRGIIRHNDSTYVNPVANDWLQMYYDYSDKWGNADNKRYNQARTFLNGFENNIENLKTFIDEISIQQKWVPFCGHGTEVLSTAESIREWVSYALEKGCKFITFSKLFDQFGTTVIGKKVGL